MNALIKSALVISSFALSFAANATLKSEIQDTITVTTSDVVAMLNAELKVNTMDLKQQLAFQAPVIDAPNLRQGTASRYAYTSQSRGLRTAVTPK